ncbi:AI-2E family transporter [Hyphomonas sp.]|uniref:AI-2E family transporter n=1 Tax=Hyphomonas sp. TaxID=87 RepID=UPI003918F1CD
MPNGSTTSDGREPEKAPATARWAIIGIFLILAFGALSAAQSVFVPIVTALMIALVFSPVRRALGKLGVGPGAAATLIFAGTLSVLALIIYAASGTLAQRLSEAPDLMVQAEREVRQLLGAVQPMLEATEKMTEMAGEASAETVVIRQPGFFALAAQATPEVVGQIVITLTLAFFLIASGDLFYEKLVQIMPTFTDKRRALQIARDIEAQLSDYLFTITAINAGVAVLVGFTAWGFGLPDPLLFGIAAFLLNFIPYLGPITGFLIMFVTGLVVFDSPVTALAPTFVYWLINTAEGQIATPVLLGRRLRMNAVVVFLSFAVWAWLWSFMGMLLATPILLSLKVIADHVPGMNGLGKFLAARDGMSTRDQRILSFVFRRKPAPVAPPPAKDQSAGP